MNPTAGSLPPPEPSMGRTGMPVAIGALEAAELQDHLLTTFNDLERLQRLLDGMCDALLLHFSRVHERLDAAEGLNLKIDEPEGSGSPSAMAQLHAEIQGMRLELAGAITGLQFQDMGTQLINHTLRRLRNCADRLALSALGDDEDGTALIEEAPTRPNPVTQDEMDAGSVELF